MGRSGKYSTASAGLCLPKAAGIDVIPSYLAVEPRTIDPEQIGCGLLVPARALQGAFNETLLHLLERHMRWDSPADIC